MEPVRDPEITPEAAVAIPGEVSRVGLRLPEGLSYDDWARAGTLIQDIGKAVPWWLGDWLSYGEARYGEKYTRAVADTGYSAQTLMNVASVCRRVDASRRREGLSFAHHAEVAALPPDAQVAWLERAGRDRLSVSALRAAIRTSRGREAPGAPKEGQAAGSPPAALPGLPNGAANGTPGNDDSEWRSPGVSRAREAEGDGRDWPAREEGGEPPAPRAVDRGDRFRARVAEIGAACDELATLRGLDKDAWFTYRLRDGGELAVARAMIERSYPVLAWLANLTATARAEGRRYEASDLRRAG